MSSGLPQLDFSTYVGQFFWCTLFLSFIYFQVRCFANRITSVKCSRDEKIDCLLAEIDSMNRDACSYKNKYDRTICDTRKKCRELIESTVSGMEIRLNESIDSFCAEIIVEEEDRVAGDLYGVCSSVDMFNAVTFIVEHSMKHMGLDISVSEESIQSIAREEIENIKFV